jgi:hypothetical protein
MKLQKKKILTLLVVFIVWLFITLLTTSGDLATDSIFEIGFPLVFYRQCNGKFEPEIIKLGFDYPNLFIDVLCLFIVFFLFMYLKKKINHK